MKGSRIVLLVALGLTAAAPLEAKSVGVQAPETGALAPLAGCAGRLGASVKGLEAIRAVCPDIEQTLASLKLDVMLPADWRTRLDATAIGDLSALETRYTGQSPSARADDAILRSIAARLNGDSGSPSWWHRLFAWLESVFEPKDGGSRSWLRTLPAWLLNQRAWWWVRQVILTLIVVTLVVIAMRELRAVGGSHGAESRGKPPQGTRRDSHAPPNPAGRAEEGQPIDGRQHPALLLHMLIEALRRSRRIDHDRSLTWREIMNRARFDTPAQRDGFTRIALLAEHELFGPPGWIPNMPDDLRDSVEVLRTQLLAAP